MCICRGRATRLIWDIYPQQKLKDDKLEEQRQRIQHPLIIEGRLASGESVGESWVPDFLFPLSDQASTILATGEPIRLPSYSADTFWQKVRTVEAALWGGNGPIASSATPITPDQGRGLCIARLERELQPKRDITARLRGENEQDLRIHRSRAAEWREKRRTLRLRAERAKVISSSRPASLIPVTGRVRAAQTTRLLVSQTTG